MADRYTRLFIYEKEQYWVGTPIIVSACALLRDNKNDSIVAQVKLRNIGNNRVKAVAVEIVPFDTADRPLDSRTEYTFLDLNVGRDEYFGSQTPINMPDNTTRSIEVNIREIVYADNTVQDCSDCHCITFPQKQTLANTFNDVELVKQYQIKTTGRANFNPAIFEDLWLCTCGAINHKDECSCHTCKTNRDVQISALDIAELREEARERAYKAEYERKEAILERAKKYINEQSGSSLNETAPYESALSELETIRGFEDADKLIEFCNKEIETINKRKEQEKAEKIAEAKRKKRKRTAIISISICSVCILTLAVFTIIIPAINYNQALSSYNSGDYEDALEKLDNSGVFKSEDFLLKCMYAQAEEAYNAGDYVRAVNKFEDLSKTNYSDSTERMNSAKYAYVLKFVDVNKFEYKGEFSYSNTYVFRVFKQYLLDLKEIKYKNSATIYEKMLNKWKAEIIINHCDDWDWYTEADSVSIYDNSIKIYSVIYSLSDESVNIKWWYFFPKGNWYPYYPEEEKYYKLSCYDRTGFSTEPDNYYLSGTNNYFEVQLLNRDTGEKIGEKKILMNSEIR